MKFKINYLKPEEYEEKFGLDKKSLTEYICWRISNHHAIQFRDKEIEITPIEKNNGFSRVGMRSNVYRVDIVSDPAPYDKRHIIIKEFTDVESMRSTESAKTSFESQLAILKAANELGKRQYTFADRKLSVFPKLYNDEGLIKYTKKRIAFLEFISNLTLEERLHEEVEITPKKLLYDALDPIVILFRHFSMYTKKIEEHLGRPLNSFDPNILKDKALRHMEIILKKPTKSWPRKYKNELNKAFTKLSKRFNNKSTYLIDLDGRSKHNMINSLIDPHLIKGDPAFHLGYLLCDWDMLSKLYKSKELEQELSDPEEIIDFFLKTVSKKDEYLINELNIEKATPLDERKMKKGVYAAGICRNLEDFAGIEFYLKKKIDKEQYQKLETEMEFRVMSQLDLAKDAGIEEAKDIKKYFIELKNSKKSRSRKTLKKVSSAK